MKCNLILVGLLAFGCCHTRRSCECPEQALLNQGEGIKSQIAAPGEIPDLGNNETSTLPAEHPEKPVSAVEETVSGLPPNFPEECITVTEPPPSATDHGRWRELSRIRVGESHLDTVDVSADETLLLVMSSNEGAVRLYDLKKRKLLGKFEMYPKGSFENGQAMFWRGPGAKQMFIFGSQNGISLYDARTGELINILTEQPCWKMRWTDDNQYLVANLADTTTQSSLVVFFEATDSRSLREIKKYSFEDRIDGWDLSCGNRLFAATFYPTDDLRLYDLASGEKPQPIWKTAAPKYSNYVDISPHGDLVAVGGTHLLLLGMQDPSRRSVFEKYDNNINTVKFHPDAGAIVTTSYDGKVQIVKPSLDKSKMTRLKLLRHDGTANVYSVVFFNKGTRMATSSGDRTVRIWGLYD